MHTDKKAGLVLGGGGPLGVVWMAQMLSGWAAAWLAAHPENPDPLCPFTKGRIVGTSAGSIIGAWLAVHGSLDEFVARQAQPLDPFIAKKPNLLPFLLAYLKAKFLSRGGVEGFRKSMGRSSLRANVPGEQAWVELVGRAFLPAGEWTPACDFLVTVIDIETAELQAWGPRSGVPLATAVAASCAMPCTYPLVHHHGRTWMDGGIGSTTNADLAAGCRRVVILDPLGQSAATASYIGQEQGKLRAEGGQSVLFQPSTAVKRAIGLNFFDTSKLPHVADLARAQADRSADEVWRFLHTA